MILRPALTALDKRVLDALDHDRGRRARAIVDDVVRPGSGRAAQARDVLEILRGLESVGLARSDNGYWRRADPR